VVVVLLNNSVIHEVYVGIEHLMVLGVDKEELVEVCLDVIDSDSN